MQLPIVAPAPLVTVHAAAFRDLFENAPQFAHFEHYLTGLMVLPNKSLANIARCILDSADKTNLSRFLSSAPWQEAEVNDRRIRYALEQTRRQRHRKADSVLVIDDTLCEHVGSLFAHIDRHYNHSDGTYPLAHNPVTSVCVSGPVRIPLDLRVYRRYEDVTQWETFVTKHFPDQEIPKQKKARTALHKQVDPVLLTDPEFAALHAQFQTKIALAIVLVEAAIRHKVPFGVVVFDSWYLAEELVTVLERRRKAWVSIVKKNRNIETNSFELRDAAGQPIRFAGPHIAVEDLIPHIPADAYRAVMVGKTTYWCFTLVVRLTTLGKVRLVISFANAERTGTAALLLSNRLDWSAQKILTTYLRRWPTETFYQDGKGHLGLDAYRMRSAEAIGKHWCLVFVAYTFLHLACLAPSLTKGSPPIKTIGDACRQQAQALIERLLLYVHERLLHGQPADVVFAHLFAKQRPILAP
jgi:DDE superfamily endonuclease